MTVLEEISARRQHQIARGYDAAHDDGHTDASIARGAAAFIVAYLGAISLPADRRRGGMYRGEETLTILPQKMWPWENGFNPGAQRDCLIDAATMIVAEIERIDRASAAITDHAVDPTTAELLKPTGNDGIVDAEICFSSLLLVCDTDVTEELVAGWTQDQMDRAYDWAMRVHLHASDNDDVLVPERPDFIPKFARTASTDS